MPRPFRCHDSGSLIDRVWASDCWLLTSAQVTFAGFLIVSTLNYFLVRFPVRYTALQCVMLLAKAPLPEFGPIDAVGTSYCRPGDVPGWCSTGSVRTQRQTVAP